MRLEKRHRVIIVAAGVRPRRAALRCRQVRRRKSTARRSCPVKTAPATIGQHPRSRACDRRRRLPRQGPSWSSSRPKQRGSRRSRTRRRRSRPAGRRARSASRFRMSAAEVQRQQAEVSRAQAALDNARAAQTRARDLFDRGVAARREVEDANRAVAEAEAALAQARASLAAGPGRCRPGHRASHVRRHRRRAAAQSRRSRSRPPPAIRCCGSSIRVVSKSSRRSRSPMRHGSRSALRRTWWTHRPAIAEIALKVLSRPVSVEAGTATVPVRLALRAPTRTFPPGHRCRWTSRPSNTRMSS